jgi:hypothetical protein
MSWANYLVLTYFYLSINISSIFPKEEIRRYLYEYVELQLGPLSGIGYSNASCKYHDFIMLWLNETMTMIGKQAPENKWELIVQYFFVLEKLLWKLLS